MKTTKKKKLNETQKKRNECGEWGFQREWRFPSTSYRWQKKQEHDRNRTDRLSRVFRSYRSRWEGGGGNGPCHTGNWSSD
jgi:hypothetical protein